MQFGAHAKVDALMETGLLIQTTRTLQICLPVVTLSHGSGCGGGEDYHCAGMLDGGSSMFDGSTGQHQRRE